VVRVFTARPVAESLELFDPVNVLETLKGHKEAKLMYLEWLVYKAKVRAAHATFGYVSTNPGGLRAS